MNLVPLIPTSIRELCLSFFLFFGFFEREESTSSESQFYSFGSIKGHWPKTLKLLYRILPFWIVVHVELLDIFSL